MVFRYLQYLLSRVISNEQLVQKLSESYPIRRAAQMVVAAFLKSKNIADQSRFSSFAKRLHENMDKELKSVKDKLKEQPPKWSAALSVQTSRIEN